MIVLKKITTMNEPLGVCYVGLLEKKFQICYFSMKIGKKYDAHAHTLSLLYCFFRL